MEAIVIPLVETLILAIRFYLYILIASVVASWLIAFNVINTSNRIVYMIVDFLHRVTEPALRPIRRILPNLGPVDLSPLVLVFGLIFLQGFLARLPRVLF